MRSNVRSEKLDLRLTAESKRTLAAAARATHRSVSEFVLESALAKAEEALPDRQQFGLDEERWQAFISALDTPSQPHPRLERLLITPSVFERDADG